MQSTLLIESRIFVLTRTAPHAALSPRIREEDYEEEVALDRYYFATINMLVGNYESGSGERGPS
jgi:hypothetical protein